MFPASECYYGLFVCKMFYVVKKLGRLDAFINGDILQSI